MILSGGGVGLIIKGHSYISEKAKAHRGQSGLCSRMHLEGMRRLTRTVHQHDVPIIAQLNHGGYTCKANRVTASEYSTPQWKARALLISEIEEIEEAFANSAQLALQANFDGIQIHAAHGYLISQFLSNITNKRKDQYGGSLENRARLLMETYSKIRKAVGNEVIIGVKINCDDFAEKGGFTLEESIKVMRWLEEKGIDFIEISGGGPQQVGSIRKTRARAPEGSGIEEATFGGHAIQIRKKVKKVKKKLRITQIKSGIGAKIKHKATLRALKLTRHQKSVIHGDTPQIRGMVRQVCHLVRVEEE